MKPTKPEAEAITLATLSLRRCEGRKKTQKLLQMRKSALRLAILDEIEKLT